MSASEKASSAGALDPKIGQLYGNTDDFDLANLLYVQNIPYAPAKYQETLQENVKSINQWLSWELKRVEDTVNDKIKSGALPKDDSIAAKFKRTSFRIKVMDVIRKDTPWLTISGIETQAINITATEDKIGIAILHAILGIHQFSKSNQVLNLVKALAYGIHETPGLAQPHAIYLVDHAIDQARQTTEPAVRTFTFSITLTEVQPPAKDAKNGKDVEKKSFEAVIKYTLNSSRFNMELWNQSKTKDEDSYAFGKKTLLQKQLTLMETAF